MSKKVFNMQGGKHSAAAYTELEKWAYGSVVASLTSFVVSAGTGMNLNISTGAGLISDTIARRIGTDATETATVPTASASFNRIDTVVAYIDTSVTPTTAVTDNTNDILKFKVVAGTAASTPVAPTGAAIISSIGAGKPYMVLYDVLVPQNATNTSGMTFTDRRVLLASPTVADSAITTAKLAALAVTTAKLADNSVTAAKMDLTTLYSLRGNLATQSFTTGLVTNTTITVPTVKANTKIELDISIEYNNEGGGLKDMQCRVLKNGVSIGDRYTGVVTGIYFTLGQWIDQFQVSTGDTLTIQFAKTNSNAGGLTVARSVYTIKTVG